jgi:hypothetical protein
MYIGLYQMLDQKVAHTCNPSYSGGSAQEDHNSRIAPAKKLVRLIPTKEKLDVVACYPSYMGSINKRIRLALP